jgi:NAD(P)-dependent dehydrogenase (short-subunit alcohol dehydrogenase family)
MSRIVEGRVAIVTGAGQGLGRSHALELSREGASLVVNDLADNAERVAAEIRDSGGIAIASIGDVANWDYAANLIDMAVHTYGGLDVLVNNAGLVRDRMLVGLSEQEWDDVVRVNLKGHFCPLRHAAVYWRNQAKSGEERNARVINTSSGSGLRGSVGQSNYAAAKAGVAALTIVAAAELAPYKITVNAIAPAARTPMTETVLASAMAAPESGFDEMDPDNVSPLVAWLASTDSRDVTGRVFEVSGGSLNIADGWQSVPGIDKKARWNPAELGPTVRELLSQAPLSAPVYGL